MGSIAYLTGLCVFKDLGMWHLLESVNLVSWSWLPRRQNLILYQLVTLIICNFSGVSETRVEIMIKLSFISLKVRFQLKFIEIVIYVGIQKYDQAVFLF